MKINELNQSLKIMSLEHPHDMLLTNLHVVKNPDKLVLLFKK
jgi:hypothetical protein